MSAQQIKHLIEAATNAEGLTETGIKGIQFFRATQAMPCAPAVYEPCVIAIVSGSKEVVLQGTRYDYDQGEYLCCPMSMPIYAGTPEASLENPLYGVLISLEPRHMAEIALEMVNAGGLFRAEQQGDLVQGIKLARWDETFSTALLRLLQLIDSEVDIAVLSEVRLREVYYAILKGEVGLVARQAFGVGNAIARSIVDLSSNLNARVSVDDLVARAGMSRAVFHRKFKQATMMSPIQFVKSLRLNNDAMKIAEGASISEAAMGVGYISSSQFSREFKRAYGQSPRQWSDAQKQPQALV